MGKSLLHAPLNPVFETSFNQPSHFFSLVIYLFGIPSIITETCTIVFVLSADTYSLGTFIASITFSQFLRQPGGSDRAKCLLKTDLTAITFLSCVVFGRLNKPSIWKTVQKFIKSTKT